MAGTITIAEWVEERIQGIFSEAAERFSSGEAWPDATEDQAAGVPRELMEAESYMIRCWHNWLWWRGHGRV